MDKKSLNQTMKKIGDYIKNKEDAYYIIDNNSNIAKKELNEILEVEVLEISSPVSKLDYSTFPAVKRENEKFSSFKLVLHDVYDGISTTEMKKLKICNVDFVEPIDINVFISNLDGTIYLLAEAVAAFNIIDDDDYDIDYSTEIFRIGLKKINPSLKTLTVDSVEKSVNDLLGVFTEYSTESILYSINNNNNYFKYEVINKILEVFPDVKKYGFYNFVSIKTENDEALLKLSFVDRFKGNINSSQYTSDSNYLSINEIIRFDVEFKISKNLIFVNVNGFCPKLNDVSFNLINFKISNNKNFSKTSLSDRLHKLELDFNNKDKTFSKCIEVCNEMLKKEVNVDRYEEIQNLIHKFNIANEFESSAWFKNL